MRILTITKRIILQNLYDKRTLALMMIAPLIVLSLVYAIFNTTSSQHPTVGVYQTKTTFNTKLEDNDLKIIKYNNDENIKDKIIDDNLTAFISYEDNEYNITYENFDLGNTNKVKGAIKSSLLLTNMDLLKKNFNDLKNKLNINTKQKSDTKVETKEHYLYLDEDASYFDTISPVLVSFFVFFFVFLIAGISLLNERTTGTLERLLSTPLKRFELVFGYYIGYGIFAIIQTIIIVLFAVYILNMPLVGSIGLVILINILVAFCALSIGILLSTFAKSEFQMMQFIPIIIIPQVFFSGIIDVSTMADWLQKLAYVFPLYYAGHSIQDVMIKGLDFNAIQFNLFILFIFIIIFTVLNIFALKKYRKT